MSKLLCAAMIAIAAFAPRSAVADGAAKQEYHDWVGSLDWCGFNCDAGEACCTVVVVQ